MSRTFHRASQIPNIGATLRTEHFSAKFVEIPKEQRSQLLENASGKRLATLLDKMRTETAKRKMLFKKIPDKGDLDLDVVHDSTYFFS